MGSLDEVLAQSAEQAEVAAAVAVVQARQLQLLRRAAPASPVKREAEPVAAKVAGDLGLLSRMVTLRVQSAVVAWSPIEARIPEANSSSTVWLSQTSLSERQTQRP
ncbi:MAG: hypothetical protein R2882_15760 [Gemmatimonadales bacterium]